MEIEPIIKLCNVKMCNDAGMMVSLACSAARTLRLWECPLASSAFSLSCLPAWETPRVPPTPRSATLDLSWDMMGRAWKLARTCTVPQDTGPGWAEHLVSHRALATCACVPCLAWGSVSPPCRQIWLLTHSHAVSRHHSPGLRARCANKVMPKTAK